VADPGCFMIQDLRSQLYIGDRTFSLRE